MGLPSAIWAACELLWAGPRCQGPDSTARACSGQDSLVVTQGCGVGQLRAEHPETGRGQTQVPKVGGS